MKAIANPPPRVEPEIVVTMTLTEAMDVVRAIHTCKGVVVIAPGLSTLQDLRLVLERCEVEYKRSFPY